ncbi:hypothetical protein E5Q_03032 [Mixia osmundae IAM 14324]|uniref:Uncharacterized protein n=1 Tax=Mixia osmundae (strain CBS 9802 / IAM 14324 / JCM 22182 / KY 12970) TaxID=764103 RepID=G7E0K6_MIXOS|nr:hypothetical protein E5Q_03032 [Mixia osmundae IAM 14324]
MLIAIGQRSAAHVEFACARHGTRTHSFIGWQVCSAARVRVHTDRVTGHYQSAAIALYWHIHREYIAAAGAFGSERFLQL